MTGLPGNVLWTSEEAAAATAGVADLPWRASGISIDTRTLRPGDLFVALKGPNFDAHAFVAEAMRAGAAACLVAADAPLSGIEADAPLLKVADTMRALQDLGIAARARTGARVVGITGSVGKTGCKEALAYVLESQGVTSASQGSLNNHWGLPLSLARMPRHAVFGIFEMGMNHPGEIRPLSAMARPHVALITTVASVHSQFFDGEEAIADAKAEIFSGMAPGGTAVLNRDNRHFQRLAEAATDAGIARVIGFGASQEAKFRLLEAIPDENGTDVVAVLGSGETRYRLGLPGSHWVINSLAVLASVAAAGGNALEAARAFGDFKAPKGRGRRHAVALLGGTMTLIDESYNASPVSMAAAIEVLGRTRPKAGGRRIAVLGDMLELGESSAERHAALAEPLGDAAVDLLFTAGPNMKHLQDAVAPAMRGGHAADAEGLAAMAVEAVGPGDVVMVKGSAGSRTASVVAALLALDAGQPPRLAVNGT